MYYPEDKIIYAWHTTHRANDITFMACVLDWNPLPGIFPSVELGAISSCCTGDALPKPPSPFTEEHILVAAILLQPAVQSVLLHSLFASMLDASTNSQNSVNAVKQVWESAKNFFEWGLTWRKEASLESLDRANNYLVLRTEILDVMIKLSCNIVEWRGILMPLMVRCVYLKTIMIILLSLCISGCVVVCNIFP